MSEESISHSTGGDNADNGPAASDSSDADNGFGRYGDDQRKMREKIRSDMTSPRIPRWDNAEALHYDVKFDKDTGEAENIVDFETLDTVNDTINSVRVALFKATRALDDTERKLKLAKTKYDREFRREYLSSTEKTEARKKEYAALMAEDIEDEVVYLDQMKIELQRRTMLLREEMSIMNTLSNNIRQQIKT